MEILKFEFADITRSWKVNSFELQPLTLLVGVSGVGKTNILVALNHINLIAAGKSYPGIKWEIVFKAISGKKILWKGEFDTHSHTEGVSPLKVLLPKRKEKDHDTSKIIYEEVVVDDKVVVDRTKDRLLFNGIETVKLSREKSVVSLLKEEDLIDEIAEALSKIKPLRMEEGLAAKLAEDVYSETKDLDTLEKIQISNLSLRLKILALHENCNDIFDEIVDEYIAIFPFVEEVKFSPISNNKSSVGGLHSIIDNLSFIQIRELENTKWIAEFEMSSGMLKTLYFLFEIKLSPKGTVFLIDEFENSLGINCIDSVSDAIMSSCERQFILTSHHPYIINKIPVSYWKLVKRKKSVVSVENLSEDDIGKSRHDAFIRLMNMDAYLEGISS